MRKTPCLIVMPFIVNETLMECAAAYPEAVAPPRAQRLGVVLDVSAA